MFFQEYSKSAIPGYRSNSQSQPLPDRETIVLRSGGFLSSFFTREFRRSFVDLDKKLHMRGMSIEFNRICKRDK